MTNRLKYKEYVPNFEQTKITIKNLRKIAKQKQRKKIEHT